MKMAVKKWKSGVRLRNQRPRRWSSFFKTTCRITRRGLEAIWSNLPKRWLVSCKLSREFKNCMASSEQKGYQPDSPDQKSKREKEIAKMEQFVLDMVSRTELETKASMDESLNKAINALENEKTETRERGKDNKPGGIVELRKDIPTLIIPDLHARKDYLAKALMQRDP